MTAFSLSRRHFMAGAGAVALVPSATGAQPAALAATFDAYLAPFVAARDFAGAVEIRRGGRPVLRRAYGGDNRGGRNTVRTRFGIQSVSKLITEGTLLALEDQHLLSLSDPLARWLPDFPRAREVTLEMLVTHRSGLARDLADYAAVRARPHDLDQLTALVAASGYVAAPGGAPAYSNNGYRILAAVIARAAGTDYHAACRRLLLAPLGLDETGPMFGAPVPNLARGMRVGFAPRSLEAPPATDMSNEQGAASFCATVGDLATLIAHYPFRPIAGRAAPARYGHDGFGIGYMAFAYRFAAGDTIVAMAGNVESGLLSALEADLPALALGQPPHPPAVPAERPAAAAALALYAGRYAIGPGQVMVVSLRDGRLAVDAGDGPSALWAIGPDLFFCRERYATLAFIREGSAIVRIDWTEGGHTFPCARVSA